MTSTAYSQKARSQILFSIGSFVFALVLIFVSYNLVQPTPIAKADCEWSIVLPDPIFGCPEGYGDVGGWCGAWINCGPTGGGDPGGGGPGGGVTCPANYTVDLGCPAPNYSGSHTIQHTYIQQDTCIPSTIVPNPDGTQSCTLQTTCVDVPDANSEQNSCVGQNYCTVNGVNQPAPNNDTSQCPLDSQPACSPEDYWISCLGGDPNQGMFGNPNSAYEYPGGPPSGEPYSHTVTKYFGVRLQDTSQQYDPSLNRYICVYDHEDADLSHATYCDANPTDPTCCTVAPTGPIISPATIYVVSPVSWTINPGGVIGPSPTQITPPAPNTTYTITPSASCASPTVTSTVNGVSSGGSSVVLSGGEVVNFTITCTPPFTYTLGQPANVSVTVGSSGNNSIPVTLTGGTAQAVSFPTISGAPAGVTISYPSCTPSSGSCSSIGTIVVGSAVPTGAYTISVTSSPAPGDTKSFTLTVLPTPLTSDPSGPPGTTGTPNPVATSQQVTWTSCKGTGGTPPYTYTWTGTDIPTSPVQTTLINTYKFTYTTTGTKTMNVSIKDSGTPAQNVSCTPGTVKVVLNAQFQEF